MYDRAVKYANDKRLEWQNTMHCDVLPLGCNGRQSTIKICMRVRGKNANLSPGAQQRGRRWIAQFGTVFEDGRTKSLAVNNQKAAEAKRIMIEKYSDYPSVQVVDFNICLGELSKDGTSISWAENPFEKKSKDRGETGKFALRYPIQTETKKFLGCRVPVLGDRDTRLWLREAYGATFEQPENGNEFDDYRTFALILQPRS